MQAALDLLGVAPGALEHARGRQARGERLAVGVGEQRILRIHLAERAALRGRKLVGEERKLVGGHAVGGQTLAQTPLPEPSVEEDGDGRGDAEDGEDGERGQGEELLVALSTFGIFAVFGLVAAFLVVMYRRLWERRLRERLAPTA